MERALDALAMTLEREGKFDLVMTELHMPDMDGLQLLDEIQKTSKLPVVSEYYYTPDCSCGTYMFFFANLYSFGLAGDAVMSADSNEDAMLTSLKKGAVCRLVKPIAIESMRDLWQYVFLKRKEKQLQPTGQKSDLPVESIGENESDQVVGGSALVSSGTSRYKEPTLTDLLEISNEKDEYSLITSSARKKAKLTWTDELHNKFLFSIRELGVDSKRNFLSSISAVHVGTYKLITFSSLLFFSNIDAYPKEILNRMGVKGLTKDHVSSHLQVWFSLLFTLCNLFGN